MKLIENKQMKRTDEMLVMGITRIVCGIINSGTQEITSKNKMTNFTLRVVQFLTGI